MLVGLTAASVIVVDQVTKAIAVASLSGREPVELLAGALTLRLIRNPGAAFGLASGFTIVLSVLAMAVSIAIVRFARRLTSLRWAVALGLLLGGALGNLVDRVFRSPGLLRGHVIDFLDSPVTLVFNIADVAITCAGVGMVVLTLRGVQLDGSRDDDDDG